MSGGSWNYMYRRENLDAGELEAMADRLTAMGVFSAASRTRSLVLDYHDPLRKLWKAIEWRDSCDTGDDDLREAIDLYYKESRDR